MSHEYFANIDENNIVIDVHVVSREFLEANPDRYTGVWVETFYDVAGKTYAGIGYTYDAVTNDFTAPVEPIQPPPPTP